MLITIAGTSLAQQTALPGKILASHNAIRARVGVPDLTWSPRLAAHAQEWADALLRSGRFAHRPNPVYGENLFDIRGGQASAEEVVEAWAGEVRDYDYSRNTCAGVCGHYTQIVWSDSRHVGCGVARGRGREVWVCSYDPPGNWVGHRPY